MLKYLSIVTAVIVPLFATGCDAQQKTSSVIGNIGKEQVDTLSVKGGNRIVLKTDYDLLGKTYVIPDSVVLIGKGGVFKNGTLIGKNTKIDSEKPIFNHVTIAGDWIVPTISTKLFKNISYDNSLKDVIGLSSPSINNIITIEKGDYNVSATDFGAALQISSNTVLIINGNIHLIPNDFRGCYVLCINNADNVVVRGEGMIEGDRVNHTGTKGEWGHGIYIDASNNVSINDIAISNCWGDCIYVGGNSTNISIKSCKLNKGRRQGMSITSGNHINVSNCDITDIYGTEPQFAIDIEPNESETVNDIVIEDVRINNCYGGVMSWGGATGCSVGKVTLSRCTIKNTRADYPVRFFYGAELEVKNCVFETGKRPGLVTNSINQVRVNNNTISSTNKNAVVISKANKSEDKNNRILK